MYISTGCYYDIYLKDKGSDAVMAEILKLRAEIVRLKYKLESPTYLTDSAGYYMEEAESLSDRVAIMKDGKLLVFDTSEQIKKMAEVDKFEEAFIRIVKGVSR